MEKLYVHEIGSDGAVSTVGLFYSRGEAEQVVARLRSISFKANCRYEIIEVGAPRRSGNPPGRARDSG